MRGVTFNGKHSYWDWGLLLVNHPIVSPPEPKTKVVEIPGSDVVIDLTEKLTGQVHYKQRDITCFFTLVCERDKWHDVYSDILNHIHGKTVRIVLDDDEEYAYTGRAEIKQWEPGLHAVNLTIAAEVNPYKTARSNAGRKVL